MTQITPKSLNHIGDTTCRVLNVRKQDACYAVQMRCSRRGKAWSTTDGFSVTPKVGNDPRLTWKLGIGPIFHLRRCKEVPSPVRPTDTMVWACSGHMHVLDLDVRNGKRAPTGGDYKSTITFRGLSSASGATGAISGPNGRELPAYHVIDAVPSRIRFRARENHTLQGTLLPRSGLLIMRSSRNGFQVNATCSLITGSTATR